MGVERVVVVGGGISGLATAHKLMERSPGIDLKLLEKAEAVGGTARSDRAQGYTVDWGPNGFLTNVPQTYDLASAVGLDDHLQAASGAVNRRYLLKEGVLTPLPGSPPAFAKSPLLPMGAKLRILTEPFAAKRDPEVDETVYEFAQRRLGTDFAEAFIRPMVMGITAGDAREISLDALFPRMRAMEKTHGSLIKAMFARMKEAKTRKGSSDGPTGPFGRLTSFGSGGMQTLCDAIRDHLGDRVQTGVEVRALARLGNMWRLELSEGDPIDTEALVLAVPAQVAARLLRPHDADMADLIDTIPYVGVRVLGLGYDLSDIPRDLDGFGFLALPGNGVRLLGCVWTSAIFPDQAPTGKGLLRIITGGSFDPEIVGMDDEAALDAVRADLAKSMGIEAPPEFVKQILWPNAIPQYTRGHKARAARIMAAAEALPNLTLTGNAFNGVSLNDCVKDAARAAEICTRAS